MSNCENWKRFLSAMFGGDESVIENVRVAIGHTLMGSMREAAFLLVGSAASGKSTFLHVLRAMTVNAVVSDGDVQEHDMKQWTHSTDGKVLWAAWNEVPKWLWLASDDGALRRVTVYQTEAGGRDPALLSKLVQELPAIREWATADLPAWKRPEWKLPHDVSVWKKIKTRTPKPVASRGRVG